MITIYGIKNCDTMKKALKWLGDAGVAYEFHDFKKAGVNEELLQTWLAQVEWQTLLNRSGTSWRKLPQQIRDQMDKSLAIATALDNPSVIKRPLLDINGKIHIGFKADDYLALFS